MDADLLRLWQRSLDDKYESCATCSLENVSTNLQRCREVFMKSFRHWHSYNGPLSLHFSFTKRFHPRLTSAVLNTHPCCDKAANNILKSFSDKIAARFEELKDPRYLLYLGLNTCGRARDVDHEAVMEDLKSWVQGPTTWGERDKDWVTAWLFDFIGRWVEDRAATNVPAYSFDRFLDDPTMYSTSGSAPQVMVDGKAFRNKWAWAADKFAHYGSVSRWYREEGLRFGNSRRCAVALKQESTKIRLVVAAPMSSHLRQSYIYESLGDPRHLRSTLSHPNITSELIEQGWTSLIGLDASLFDHNVPFWFLSAFYRFIAHHCRRCGMGPVADVALCELSELKQSYCVYRGESVKYRKGVLSGWRLTSLLDSVISQCTVDYIYDHHVPHTPFSYMVQGDDVMLQSYGTMNARNIIKTAERFGTIINRPKSTTGPSGEFLKYAYTPSGVIGYPARALRSIFWANPWIPELESKFPSHIAKSWWTYFSRLRPFVPDIPLHRMQQLVADDLARWGGAAPWKQYVATPQSVGGAAPLEVANYLTPTFVVSPGVLVSRAELRLPNNPVFPLANAYGAYTSAMSVKKATELRVIRAPRPVYGMPPVRVPAFRWPREVNRWKTYLSWLGADVTMVHGSVLDMKDVPWPRYAKLWKPLRRIRWLLATDNIAPSDSLTGFGIKAATYVEAVRRTWVQSRWSRSEKVGLSLTKAVGLALDAVSRAHTHVFHTM